VRVLSSKYRDRVRAPPLGLDEGRHRRVLRARVSELAFRAAHFR
jgi:hypothetical protein